MTALIVGYLLAGASLLVFLLPPRAWNRHLASATDDELAGMRQSLESPMATCVLGVWSFMATVGAFFLIVRGHPIGIAWVGVAVMYAIAGWSERRRRRRLLTTLGDRGRTTRHPRNARRLQIARRFAVVSVATYVAAQVMRIAHPEPVPAGATVAVGVAGFATFIAAAGWLVMRTLVYVALDDDKAQARRQASN